MVICVILTCRLECTSSNNIKGKGRAKPSPSKGKLSGYVVFDEGAESRQIKSRNEEASCNCKHIRKYLCSVLLSKEIVIHPQDSETGKYCIIIQ